MPIEGSLTNFKQYIEINHQTTNNKMDQAVYLAIEVVNAFTVPQEECNLHNKLKTDVASRSQPVRGFTTLK